MSEIVTILKLLSDVCLAATAIGCLYLLAASAMVLSYRRSDIVTAPRRAEPVTLLKPLHGAEPGLSQRLHRFCRQDYPAEVQMVCGIADAADPAAKAVDRCRMQGDAVDLVVARRHGSNPKISSLVDMLKQARHDLLIISDSDIDVENDYVAKTAAALLRPGVGAVTCLYRGIGSGLWSQLSALAINSHFLPNAIVALTLGLGRPCFGATIALRRSMLRRIGGFDAFKDVLADDNAIGRAVRATGQRVVVPGFAVGHVCQERSLRALLVQDLRVARTIRSVDPIGYAGLVITHPFALALLAVPLSGANAAILVGLALACRVVLCLAVKRAFTLEPQKLRLIPLRDLLSFAAYVGGFLGDSVQWRNASYRIVCDGRLSPGRTHA